MILFLLFFGIFLTSFITVPIVGILFATSVILHAAGKGMKKGGS